MMQMPAAFPDAYATMEREAHSALQQFHNDQRENIQSDPNFNPAMFKKFVEQTLSRAPDFGMPMPTLSSFSHDSSLLPMQSVFQQSMMYHQPLMANVLADLLAASMPSRQMHPLPNQHLTQMAPSMLAPTMGSFDMGVPLSPSRGVVDSSVPSFRNRSLEANDPPKRKTVESAFLCLGIS